MKRRLAGIAIRAGLAWCMALAGGCGGDARLELSAADALQAVAGQMALTVEEYHGEVSRIDASRESEVIAAFVARVRQDASDEAALASHTAAFEAALHKIRADREVEYVRRGEAMQNVAVLREVARGLQKLAIQSLGLQDEIKRYLEGWITLQQREERASGRNNRADRPGQSDRGRSTQEVMR